MLIFRELTQTLLVALIVCELIVLPGTFPIVKYMNVVLKFSKLMQVLIYFCHYNNPKNTPL